MNNKGLVVTVVGWAASKPREISGEGVAFTSFRLATTPRFFDNRQGTWADGQTEWLTVKVFRDVALNVAGSINKGDPLVVHGKLRTEEWQADSGPRSRLVLEASALGHDLTWGRAVFARTVHIAPATARAEGGGDRCDDDVDPWARVENGCRSDGPAGSGELAPVAHRLNEDAAAITP